MDAALIERKVQWSLDLTGDDACESVLWIMVNEAERAAADTMLALLIHDLRLPRDMRVKWFRSHTGPACALPPERTLGRFKETTYGFYREALDHHVVWIRAGMGPQQTARAVAHECRHAWQHFKLGDWAGDRKAREYDAYVYEDELIAGFSEPKGH